MAIAVDGSTYFAVNGGGAGTPTYTFNTIDATKLPANKTVTIYYYRNSVAERKVEGVIANSTTTPQLIDIDFPSQPKFDLDDDRDERGDRIRKGKAKSKE